MIDPSETALLAAVELLSTRKAEDLTILDLRGRSPMTDYFVICHGNSDRQVKSLADEVTRSVAKQVGKRPRIEGGQLAEWILIDYGDFVVHVFSAAARELYRLEALWYDAPVIDT